MLRPSASMAKARALAAASMSPSLPSIRGNSNANSSRAARNARRPAVPLRRSLSVESTLAGRLCGGDAERISSADLSLKACSRLRWRRAAEKAGRAEHEHQDQDREDDDVGPAHRKILAAEGFDQSDRHASEHRSGNVTDAAKHRGREGAQAGGIADDEARVVVVQAEDQAGSASKRGTYEEGDHHNRIDVDAHHPRRLLVLGGRLHRLAHLG